jgi:hypothetical protein
MQGLFFGVCVANHQAPQSFPYGAEIQQHPVISGKFAVYFVSSWLCVDLRL